LTRRASSVDARAARRLRRTRARKIAHRAPSVADRIHSDVFLGTVGETSVVVVGFAHGFPLAD